jgi:hypothetical protein
LLNSGGVDASPRNARIWFALTAAAVFAGVLIQVLVSAGNEEGLFPTAAGRVFNVFWYFTIQSNLLVGVTSLMLALRPERGSELFCAFRLTGLVAITVTFIVFHTALSHLVDLQGWAKVADQILHTVVPLLAVGTWLKFGPRGLVDRSIALLALVPPLLWVVFTLIRGEMIDFYPYPFVDVNDLGYARVIANTALIALLFLALAVGAHAIDRKLVPRGGNATSEETEREGFEPSMER